MDSSSLEVSAATQNSIRKVIDVLTSHIPLWLFSVSLFMVLGIFFMIGPKQSFGSLQIGLAPGHAITTQDVIALLPISVASLLFATGLWKHREAWMGYIQRSPIKSFFLALVIGLAIGFLFGLPLGVVYRIKIQNFIISIRSIFG